MNIEGRSQVENDEFDFRTCQKSLDMQYSVTVVVLLIGYLYLPLDGNRSTPGMFSFFEYGMIL